MTDDEHGSGGGETTFTVVLAFFANAGIALAKTVVAMITGSASMLAESAHSWADTGNEVLLLVADKRSRRAARRQSRPLGYGREAYVWSMFAAMGLFVAGAVVSVWNGVTKLFEPSEETSYFWAYVVLGIAFVLEGVSFAQAYRQTRREAHGLDRRVVEHALQHVRPDAPGRVRRGLGGAGGLVIATLGIFLHQVTGDAAYDAVGVDPGRDPARRGRGGADQPQPVVPDRAGEQTGASASGCSATSRRCPRSTRSPTSGWSSSVPASCCSWRAST